jgi:hypothetical protein
MIDEYTIKPNRIPTPRSSFDSPDVCFLHGKHPEFTSQPNAGYQLAVLTATLIRLPSSIFPVLVNFPTGSLEMFTDWRLRKVALWRIQNSKDYIEEIIRTYFLLISQSLCNPGMLGIDGSFKIGER